MKLSIIIPAYNEEERIGRTLQAYSDFFEPLRKREILDYELLIVINNTRDNTEDVVKSAQKTNKRIKYLNFKRGGKGFAVIEGFKDALKRENDLIGFTDADMATSPAAFYDLVKTIKSTDGIIANRYSKYSKIKPKFSFRTLFVSAIFNFIVRTLFAIKNRDTQCGAKLFKRETISKIINSLIISQWAFDIELLYQAKRRGLKIAETPTIWTEQPGSKIRIIHSSLQMFLAVIQLRIVNSPFKRLLRPFKYPIGLLWRQIK